MKQRMKQRIKCPSGRIYRKGFVVGTRWMAKQGLTFDYTLTGRNTIENLNMEALAEKGICFGDNVIVQIRKKQ